MIRAASLLDSFVALEALGQEFFNAIPPEAVSVSSGLGRRLLTHFGHLGCYIGSWFSVLQELTIIGPIDAL